MNRVFVGLEKRQSCEFEESGRKRREGVLLLEQFNDRIQKTGFNRLKYTLPLAPVFFIELFPSIVSVAGDFKTFTDLLYRFQM